MIEIIKNEETIRHNPVDIFFVGEQHEKLRTTLKKLSQNLGIFGSHLIEYIR
ncbi:hypothetical protein MADE_1014805 [Alteromonas mediterranea DE]|uniref:Uncharacterized protein n=1 Tax=Alteromonas mediterranea (strain DSM 17117 / CIP 110805 / LMG 28347 / Deep ecotype) TaxID=1774373 RepID=F2GCD9_ALTMD|nr:hypothetical protein MADE_1014805 [Alteromonas mediterranea DE]